MNVEERLRTAMHAVSDGLQPDEASGLAVVRSRGRAARRRRALLGAATASMAVLAGSLAVTRLDARDEGSLTTSSEQAAPVTGPAITAPPEASTQPTVRRPPTPPRRRRRRPPCRRRWTRRRRCSIR